MKSSQILSCALATCIAASGASALSGCDAHSGADGRSGVTMVSSASYPDYTLDELAAYSNIVVSGEVVGFSEPFLVRPSTGGDPMYHTDMYVKVTDSFKGDPLPADGFSSDSAESAAATVTSGEGDTIVAVRFMGGKTDAVDFHSDEDPGLEIGDKALLFLYRVTDGSDYNTEGNHYYLVTGPCSVYEDDGTGTFVEGERSVTISDVEAAVSRPAATAAAGSEGGDPNMANNGERSLEDQIDALEKLNEEGELSDADLAVEKERAREAKENYSQVMSDEEAEEYEKSLLEESQK